MKPKIDYASSNNTIVWQEDDVDVPCQALLIDQLDDAVCITQDGNTISLNYSMLPEIGKLISKLKRPVND